MERDLLPDWDQAQLFLYLADSPDRKDRVLKAALTRQSADFSLNLVGEMVRLKRTASAERKVSSS